MLKKLLEKIKKNLFEHDFEIDFDKDYKNFTCTTIKHENMTKEKCDYILKMIEKIS